MALCMTVLIPHLKRDSINQSLTQIQANRQTESIIVTADKLQQKEKVNDAIKYIDGLKERVPDFELELIVKEKGVV